MARTAADVNRRFIPGIDDGQHEEGRLRREVRDALDLDVFTRDDQIVAEIRRLKALAAEAIVSRTTGRANY